jgi:N6-adenosine-specific RNA methylase IME4
LAELDRVRLALATVADLRQIMDLRDRAEAIRRHAKAADLGLEMQNQAAELKLVAERRAGKLLEGIPLHGGDRKSGHWDEMRLKKLGISQNASSRWQREASLPEEDFQQYLQQTRDAGRVPTSQDLLGLARVHAREMGARENLFPKLVNGLERLARQGSQFGCIHAVPPWPEGRASKANICCLVQELVDLPVEPVAAARAHLHLWTPPEFLEDALRLVRAWGFHYQTSLVRTKPPADRGSYWRQAHDVLLLGVRGELGFPDSSLLSWLDPRTDSAADSLHEIRSLIERASPGPYLELFGGNATRMWKVLSPGQPRV